MRNFRLPLIIITLIGQVYLPIRLRIDTGSVLSTSDITYLGPCRAYHSSSIDTNGAYGGMGGRTTAGVTTLFVWGPWGTDVTHPGLSNLYEVSDCVPTGTDYTTSPHLNVVTDWGYIDHGKKLNWNPSGCTPITDNGPFPGGIYWNPDTNLVYSTYATSYSGDPGWNLLATSLDNSGTGATTTYGPFRASIVDGDSVTWYGPQRFSSMLRHPTTGKMLGIESPRSINAAQSFGPTLAGGGSWPISSTPAGCGNADLTQPDRYLMYYYPNNIAANGSWTGNMRSFQFPSTLTYVQETWGPNYGETKINPALNSGKGSWTDEMSGVSGGYWFHGTYKQGMIFVGTAPLGHSTDTSDCTNAAHEWYLNAGNGFVNFTATPSPAFTNGETITGLTSGHTAQVIATDGVALGWQQSPVGLDFTVGEHLNGGTSGANAVVSTFNRQDKCTHGCSCVQCASAGPSTTTSMPLMIIYDEAKLNAVKAGSATDWQQVADSVTDMRATYGIRTASLSEGGKASALSWGYFDSTTNDFYLSAIGADDTVNPSFLQTLIHKFHINDSAPPTPMPLAALNIELLILAFISLVGYAKTS